MQATNFAESTPRLHEQKLVDRFSDPDYARRFAAIAARIQPAATPEAIVQLLREGADSIGADRAVFVSYVRHDGQLSSCRFTLACDPAWCRDYLAIAGPAHDPWLAYSRQHGEPIVAGSLVVDQDQSPVVDLAARHGFRSALLAPAHSGPGHSRSSVLYLGSAHRDYFETASADDGFALVRIGARMLACQLHDWWLGQVRGNLMRSARTTPDELTLLAYEHRGWSSKQIAGALQVSKSSVDSRFQRLNIKLGVPNRRIAARLAAECGLIRG